MEANVQMTAVGFGLASLVLFGVPVVISWMVSKRRDASEYVSDWRNAENMPIELQRAVVFMNEQDIHMTEPVRLHGRVDQVYLTNSRLLVAVDTKTRNRHRTYASDVLQLSLYGVILRQSALPVANYGYIRTVVYLSDARKSVRYHRVRLLPRHVVLKHAGA